MEPLTGEVLDIHNAYQSYGEYKAALDGELQRSAESFVRIGYLLKVAVDTDILKESGYRNVNEFAREEYNLDKSQVSRFIRINDEFSENGYSDRLQEKYRNFGYAKLALMLLLPAEINEELTADYSKADIQAIKDEIDEEKKVSDLEVMMEDKDQRQQSFTTLGKVLHQIGKDDPELYLKLHDAVCNTVYDGTSRPVIDKLMDALAPNGEAVISVRIAGEGRKMLMIKGADIDPVVVDVRSGAKTSCTWDQLIDEMEALCPGVEDGADGRKSWKILYGEPFPERREKVAPVQPQKKTDARRESKVTKAKKPEKTKAEPVSDKMETEQLAAGQQDTEKGQEDQESEGQEAAGVENEESGERKAQGEDGADSTSDRESSADSESGHDEDGTGGGCRTESSGGGADRENGTGVAPVQPESEQLEGQMNITDFPQYMPDTKKGEQENGAEAAGVEESGKETIANYEGLTVHIENQVKIMIEELQTMRVRCVQHNWDSLIERAKNIITRAESLKNMEEVYRNE